MNPNGTYQNDGMDQIELANRQYGLQQQQMAHGQSHDDLMAQIALKQLASSDAHFGAELKDRQDARSLGRQDSLNQFAAAADLTKAGWAHDDTRHSGDLAQAVALARFQKEPGQLEQQRYTDEQSQRAQVMAYLGIGGGQPTAPGAPGVAAPGAAGIDPQKLRTVAVMRSLMNGGNIPDFERQDAEHDLLKLKVDDAKQDDATKRISALLDSGQVEEAKKIAAATGAPMPQIHADALAARPEVAVGLEKLKRLISDYQSGTFSELGGGSAGIKSAMEEIVAALASHGVAPDEAQAFIKQKMDETTDKKAGLGQRVWDNMKYANPITLATGGAGRSTRANDVRSLIGY